MSWHKINSNRPKSRCDVQGCARNKLASMHLLSKKNLYLRKQWIKALQLVDSEIREHYYVCGDHFKESDFGTGSVQKKRLRSCAVPSVNLPPTKHKFHQVPHCNSLSKIRLLEYAERSKDLRSLQEKFNPKSEVEDAPVSESTNFDDSLSRNRMIGCAIRSGDLSSVKKVYNITTKPVAELSLSSDSLPKERMIGYAKRTGDLSSLTKIYVKSKAENRKVPESLATGESSSRVLMVGYAMRPGDSSSIKRIYLKTKARLSGSTIAELSLGGDSSPSERMVRYRIPSGDLSSVNKKSVIKPEAENTAAAISSVRGNSFLRERMVGNASVKNIYVKKIVGKFIIAEPSVGGDLSSRVKIAVHDVPSSIIKQEFNVNSEVEETSIPDLVVGDSLSRKRVIGYSIRSGDLSSVKKIYNVKEKVSSSTVLKSVREKVFLAKKSLVEDKKLLLMEPNADHARPFEDNETITGFP